MKDFFLDLRALGIVCLNQTRPAISFLAWTHPSPCPQGEINCTDYISNFSSSYLRDHEWSRIVRAGSPSQVVTELQYFLQGFLDIYMMDTFRISSSVEACCINFCSKSKLLWVYICEKKCQSIMSVYCSFFH